MQVKVPIGSWPKDHKLKEMGMYHREQMLACVDSYSLAVFTRVLGWSNERTQLLLAGVKNDLRNRKTHFYTASHFVYGRKPGAKA